MSKTRRRWAGTVGLVGLVVGGLAGYVRSQDAVPPPEGLRVIETPRPYEASGVAAFPDGRVLVVGDGTPAHATFWPGGEEWTYPAEVLDAESVDHAVSPEGEALTLFLGEDEALLLDQHGARATLEGFEELAGRGPEGLALRWTPEGFEAAVLWEGGYLRPDHTITRIGEYHTPKVRIVRWAPGEGVVQLRSEFTLAVPEPGNGQRFRAPDLCWDGDALLVLLSSQNASDNRFAHTWLQRFDLSGAPSGDPVRLEDRWGAYRDGKNWESLDTTWDGSGLLLGFDAGPLGPSQVVVEWPWAQVR